MRMSPTRHRSFGSRPPHRCYRCGWNDYLHVTNVLLPYRGLSVAAAAWRCGIPLTCHVTIGADIIHAHANCDGAALGQASYTDFRLFARAIAELEGRRLRLVAESFFVR